MGAAPDLAAVELSDAQFAQIGELVYRLCGINLHAGKAGLVKTRLLKRLRALEVDSFDSYLDLVRRDASGGEVRAMIDALTTNKTSFFREAQHFDFLGDRVLPDLRAEGRPMRFWSAGCSSGEEPYSLAILLREEVPDLDRMDARILATDISTRVLVMARQAVYGEDQVRGIPTLLLARYFEPAGTGGARAYRVRESVRNMIALARLNLMAEWPMKGPFDVILCRNVMIYFDKPTQHRLIRRFVGLLRPGGYLFVGHSESLAAWSSEIRYVQPAVYTK